MQRTGAKPAQQRRSDSLNAVKEKQAELGEKVGAMERVFQTYDAGPAPRQQHRSVDISAEVPV